LVDLSGAANAPDRRLKVLTVFGTRPEAIKMAPVALALEAASDIDHRLCVTGQHREMLDQVLAFFAIEPDHDLNLMQPDQCLTQLTSRVLTGMKAILDREQPDLVLVHGDTTTTLGTSLAAFYAQIPVGHVEAGLRTGDMQTPWPEEANRKLTDALASLYFAPTATAQSNLLGEGVSRERICVTGNTVVDALRITRERVLTDTDQIERCNAKFSMLDPKKKLILVTGHRRENLSVGFSQICAALFKLAKRGDCEIIYPVHLNPNVQSAVKAGLDNTQNIHLIAPQDYSSFVYLMDRCFFILTDSGGIQEEAASLGKPVLVMRETTERPEAVEAGGVKVVTQKTQSIVHAAITLLSNRKAYEAMSAAQSPYGDGYAAQRILDAIRAQTHQLKRK